MFILYCSILCCIGAFGVVLSLVHFPKYLAGKNDLEVTYFVEWDVKSELIQLTRYAVGLVVLCLNCSLGNQNRHG